MCKVCLSMLVLKRSGHMPPKAIEVSERPRFGSIRTLFENWQEGGSVVNQEHTEFAMHVTSNLSNTSYTFNKLSLPEVG